MTQPSTHPKLRPVEMFPTDQDGQRVFVVHDPSGLAAGQIVVSGPALYILSLLDGQNTLEQVRLKFQGIFGQPLPLDELEGMLAQLDAGRYLDSPAFRSHFQSLIDAYRASDARVSDGQDGYGLGEETLSAGLERLLGAAKSGGSRSAGGRLVGLVAPHLDYPRGAPCYAEAYGLLASTEPAERYVLLGTNHFGRSTGPAATLKNFQTPLGTTRTDRAFIEGLNGRLGLDLCEHEFDHQREHSVELQVLMLQHLLGAGNFEIVPVLCHDPCGANGTRSYDGRGADLHAFAEALHDQIAEDGRRTVIIAGADLSHVGTRFGDERELDASFLSEVERSDRAALSAYVDADAGSFVGRLRSCENQTRVCSAGCMYALRTALPGATPELLRYHQAVDRPSGTCVTCCAVALWA